MLTRIINGLGFAAMLIGLGGLGGNIELGKSVAVPMLVITAGALILGATSLLEVIEDEKKNNRGYNRSRRSDARPYYLR